MNRIIDTQLGAYHLIRCVARGGMSEIYLASHQNDQETCALKIVHVEDEQDCLRLQREVQALATARHPHIIAILDYGEQNGVYYYAMPYIEQGSLKEHLTAGLLPTAEVGAILTQVADALHFLHLRGTIHRDIKPGNILRNDLNQVWLADFGLAKQVGRVRSITDTDSVIGTPYYMAPELVDTPASVSSDLYALGVVVYEMVTGHVPFQGKTPVVICWKHMYEPLPLPSSLNPLISPALDQLLLRALAKDPHERFATPHAFVAAYYQALAHPETTGAPQQIVPATISLVARPLSASAVLPQKTGYARLVATAATLLVLGLAGLGITLQNQSTIAVLTANAVQVPSTPNTPATGTPSFQNTPVSAPAAYSVPGKVRHQRHDKHHKNGNNHG